MRLKRGFVLAVVMLALIAPATVRAQTILPVAIGGTFTTATASGPVGGVFNLATLENQGGTLVAAGEAIYSLCVPGVDPKNCLATIDQQLDVPVTAVTATCAGLTLTLGPFRVVSPPSLGDFVLDFDASDLSVDAPAGGSPLFCALGHRLEGRSPLGSLAPFLTRLLDLAR